MSHVRRSGEFARLQRNKKSLVSVSHPGKIRYHDSGFRQFFANHMYGVDASAERLYVESIPQDVVVCAYRCVRNGRYTSQTEVRKYALKREDEILSSPFKYLFNYSLIEIHLSTGFQRYGRRERERRRIW